MSSPLSQSLEEDEFCLAVAIKAIVIGLKLDIPINWLKNCILQFSNIPEFLMFHLFLQLIFYLGV